ncbi:unnamed protein product [Schistocephalus solidus]|uniref:Uncharacterized protein n=1 Tax=Schistocephalus solidus TaxID=70667 RepID=A0A183SWH0_SCHSO|nr:unnamed protein product [Schistocephalus solidus]
MRPGRGSAGLPGGYDDKGLLLPLLLRRSAPPPDLRYPPNSKMQEGKVDESSLIALASPADVKPAKLSGDKSELR